jgi:hypothetical protein
LFRLSWLGINASNTDLDLNYIKADDIQPDQIIFPLTYAGTRKMVVKGGEVAGINYGLTIFGGMQQPMHRDPVCILKLSAK